MKYFVIFGFICIFPLVANAKISEYSHIGTSMLFTKVSDRNYDYIQEEEQLRSPEFTNVNVGYTLVFNDKYVMDYTTNRPYSKDVERSVIHKASNKVMLNKTRITYDSFSLGRQIKRTTILAFIANTKVEKKIYSNNNLLGTQINHVWLYGLSANYFIAKNVSLNLAVIAPNEKIDLDYGLSWGVSYNF